MYKRQEWCLLKINISSSGVKWRKRYIVLMENRDDFFVLCNWISRELINLRMTEVGGGPFAHSWWWLASRTRTSAGLSIRFSMSWRKVPKYLPSKTIRDRQDFAHVHLQVKIVVAPSLSQGHFMFYIRANSKGPIIRCPLVQLHWLLVYCFYTWVIALLRVLTQPAFSSFPWPTLFTFH